jgi:DNA-binding CsgD family transcriptional regulator
MSLKFFRDTRYLVSDDGIVINNETGKVLVQILDLNGYYYVNLYDPEKHTVRVHKMVAETFLGKSDKIVNHKDGVKTNNSVSNLEYVTHSENTRHAYEIGLMKKGENKSWAKLSEKDVCDIKKMFVENISSTEIANKYKVSVGTISNIRSGRAWKDVCPNVKWYNPERRKANRKILAEDIPIIRTMFKENMTDTQIAKIYGCNRGTIFQIRCGKNWKNY